MKKQVRHCVFETNSSSTHSMVILTDEEYKKWKNKELYISLYGEVITKEEYDERMQPEIDSAVKRWNECPEDKYPRNFHKTAEDYVKGLHLNCDFDEEELTYKERERVINGEKVHSISITDDCD